MLVQLVRNGLASLDWRLLTIFRQIFDLVVLSIFVLLAVMLFSAQVAADVTSTEQVMGSQSHEQGRKIYNFRCYYCHGYSGDAKTLAATFLVPLPRDFTAFDIEQISRQQMVDAVTHGRENTAMKSFARMLTAEEIVLVVDFVRVEFMQHKKENTRYHTLENGWPDHQRYESAYPFATGAIPLDKPTIELSQEERIGKRLFLKACISCHDRATVTREGDVWVPEAVSYPRTGFKPGDSFKPPDAVSGASAFARHDIPPTPAWAMTPDVREGERLFQQNCAFCHGADGSGKNWIGTFLEPHARDLRNPQVMDGMTVQRMRLTIRNGLTGTSMPAWRSVLDNHQIDAIITYIDKVIYPLSDEKGE